MEKIVYLIPPSEGKKVGNTHNQESLNFLLNKPCEIAINVSEKDLKCTGKRYDEGVELNSQLCTSRHIKPAVCTIQAIDRYSGVMFNAINYHGMSKLGKGFFEENFLILSGMYGIVKPLDKIGNYKLPIEAKGLLDFWGIQIIEALNNAGVTKVINLLPKSYAKMIYGKNKTQEKIFSELRKFEIEDKIFYKSDGKRMAHGVKKVKGNWINNLCNDRV